MIRWLTHPYWGTAYCPKHETDGTRRCDGCDRVEPRRNRGGVDPGGASSSEFAELPDGRALCLECASTAVIDTTHDAPPLYDDVCEFMASVGLPLAARPPSRSWRRTRSTPPTTRRDGTPAASREPAACLFEEHVVYAVERTPEWAGWFLPWGSPSGCGFVPGYAVNAIIVLYGLPAVAAGAVLAHECVHAQIRLGGLPAARTEGGGGVVSARRAPLGGEGGEQGCSRPTRGRVRPAGGKSENTGGGGCGGGWEETNLAAMAGYVANQIRTDPSEVYGTD